MQQEERNDLRPGLGCGVVQRGDRVIRRRRGRSDLGLRQKRERLGVGRDAVQSLSIQNRLRGLQGGGAGLRKGSMAAFGCPEVSFEKNCVPIAP